MKVLITVTYFVPNLSGLTLAVKNLAELLAENSYHITILTTQHEKNLTRKEKINKLSILRIPYLMRLSKGFIYKFLLFEIVMAVSANDQIIINLPQFEGFLIALTAKLMRKKVHCYYHCTVSADGGFISAFVLLMLRMANALCLFLADTIIATSEDFAQHDSLLKKYRYKLVYAYPVIKELPITPIAKANIAAKEANFKGIQIGFVGRFAKEKGIEYLLKSIPGIQKRIGSQFKIYLAGSNNVVGEHAYAEKINNLIAQYKENVVYLGVIPADELGAFYNSLNVLIIPSINATEAFGMVQVEAMRLGVPVIATNLPGVRVPIQKTKMGILVPVKNSVSISEAVCAIAQNPDLYKKDKHVVVAEFSPDRILQTFKSILTAS
jgi:glycosyltransferase involved in cell wall biosynthesis